MEAINNPLPALSFPLCAALANSYLMSNGASLTLNVAALLRLKEPSRRTCICTRATPPFCRTYVSRPKPNQSLKVLPFVFIFVAGTGAFITLVKARAGEAQNPRGPSVTPK